MCTANSTTNLGLLHPAASFIPFLAVEKYAFWIMYCMLIFSFRLDKALLSLSDQAQIAFLLLLCWRVQGCQNRGVFGVLTPPTF